MQAIAHNLLSQFTNRQLNITTKDKAKTSEKLASGYRINRSADDAAGLQISEKLRWQIRGLNRGMKNTTDGISWVQIGDGAMNEAQAMIQRVRELAVQASNDTNTDEDREAINNEILQIKKEINHIARETTMNTKEIFDNSYVSMDVINAPDDLQVFNATYDSTTGDVSWGGFVFHGERITWDKVSAAPPMVQVDPVTGEQVFVGGDYTYIDPATGCKFMITCEDGAEVPDITRTLDLSADLDGVTIDGTLIGWENLIDDDGFPLTPDNVHEGAWSLEYEGALIGFYVGAVETIQDVAEAIDSCRNGKVSYTWKTGYIGEVNERAVDANIVRDLRISNGFANSLGAGKVKYFVRAGQNAGGGNGIWLENVDGTMVNGSFRSWADMGITSWDSGTDISRKFTYTYSDDEGVNDTYMAFDFVLSDITSLDSVIDGLDGMEISERTIRTSYSTNLNRSLDDNVVKAGAASRNPITFEEERQLGRDFDMQQQDAVADANVEYDGADGKARLEFKDASGNVVVSYEGQAASQKRELETDLDTYLAYVLRRKMAIALSGGDPQAADLGTGSLTDLLGAGNITTSGYFDGTLQPTGSMYMSDGEGSYHPGTVGREYPTAMVDFSGLGSKFTLDDLLGLGFNSTCKTCDNHYSIVFTDGASGDVTPEGYAYTFKKQGSDYTLQIDINSLKAQGVTTGADLARAMVDITSQCFDFHFTQYAADGSKLYVYDDREQSGGTRSATFDTEPFNAIDTDEFHFSLKADDGRSIDLTYVYDYGDAADDVIVKMESDKNGEYVRLADNTYVKYDAVKHAGMEDQRCSMSITYKNADGTTAANQAEMVESYISDAMGKMLNESNIQLDATDYTYMELQGDENPNVAVRAVFDSYLEETPYENGIHIQNSSNCGDAITIPRFPFNTVVLRLFRADVRTYEQAQDTIGYADYALSFISEKRSLYGAYQNRMEHIYAISGNTAENSQAAESRIRDMDMAEGMVEYSKHNILEQAGQSMLAQANVSMQGVLTLLNQ